MTAYVLNFWPCARYVDNVSKVFNEICFMAMMVCCSFIKEAGNSVNKFDASNSSPANTFNGTGNMMLTIMGINMGYHGVRMIHNSVQAAKTIKMRRQQIVSKWMGPPGHNDPDYSTDPDTDIESDPEPVPEPVFELDIKLALLKVPPVPSVTFAPFNEIKDRSLFPQPFHDMDKPTLPTQPEPEVPIIAEPEKPDEEGDAVIEIDLPIDIELEIEVP